MRVVVDSPSIADGTGPSTFHEINQRRGDWTRVLSFLTGLKNS